MPENGNVNIAPKARKTPVFFRKPVFLSGGDKRDRTADLLNAIQALSQLSYTPISGSLSDSFCIIAHMKEKSRGISLFVTIFCVAASLGGNGDDLQ